MTRPNRRRPGRPPVDGVQQHRDWLALVEITGPFLSLPVLRQTWPTLDALDLTTRESLRRAHAEWRADAAAGQQAWIDYLLRTLLDWRAELITDEERDLDALAVEVPEHDATITPSFVLVGPDSDRSEIKPDSAALLGLRCSPGHQPIARVAGSAWAATPVDRMAQLCRHHDIELGLVTDGRWWALVWAPRGGVTSTAIFDAVAWAESAERDVVRAFCSLLGRRRFFGVSEDEGLVPLLRASLDSQEDITEALGVQVRQAVELLVAAIGRVDVRERAAGGPGLAQVSAHEVYRGAVSVMMRLVFLLFAEERRLLPSDNELYARAYSASRLCAELEQRALEGTEEELENSYAAWHRLLALFTAVHDGIDHPRLRMPAHDGSLFDPEAYPWLPLAIDDRTVLHMLRAVQHVQVGTGRNKERRSLSFRQLDVEQIGYVYEGLLSFEGLRADGVVLGLVGKAGVEEEVPLAELEGLASRFIGRPLLAAELAERFKSSGIGSAKALEKRLTPADPTEREDVRKKLLAVTDGDYPLAERLLPFAGLIRDDLRTLPVVILPGALYVTESALRRNTGTHYTPRKLAEEVVLHALQPLIYRHGPLQTADRVTWEAKSSAEILQLKVADIAMGSAAFLVAAARYLGDALIDAWVREGTVPAPQQDDTRPVDADEDPLVVEARRQIIEHCLYGVDINPMAVEMAKLSLWLVSMDPKRPFTFLDDRLVMGDSLLGISSLDQLEYLHPDPTRGREVHRDVFDWTGGLRDQVVAVAELRKKISDIELGDDPIGALEHKRALLSETELRTGRLRLFADLLVGAALGHAARGHSGLDAGSVLAARLVDDVVGGRGEAAAREQRARWLHTDQPDGSFDRSPLHWPLVFPEVFGGERGQRDGFDAIIGNPPFLGGVKIAPLYGAAYRSYLASCVGTVRRTNVDIVAYFVLRAHELLSTSGQSGLIATNSLAQGDTRDVGLRSIVGTVATLRAAIKSRPWPSRSAALEYCAVWTSRAPIYAGYKAQLDGVEVASISASLDGSTGGSPLRLVSNSRGCYLGVSLMGSGFILDPEEARQILTSGPEYTDVVFPLLNGSDLNSRPDSSGSRWVINFGQRDLDECFRYPLCLGRLRETVKLERENRSNVAATQTWWRHWRSRPELTRALTGLKCVIALTIVSRTVMPILVPTGQVFSNALAIFTTEDTAVLGLLSSAPHYWWAVAQASSMKADLRYTPSDVFETFPLPDLTSDLRTLGDQLDSSRRSVMLARQTGLTKTYNLVFDPAVTDNDITELRAIHRAIDEATVRAYGWDDLLDQLDHGFHPAGRDLRYTIGPAAQREILDRLLELNHARYAEEVARGLHDKKIRRPTTPKRDSETLF